MIQLANILFIDIETVPIVYNYNDLTAEQKQLWDKKWSYNKDVSSEHQYAKAGIYAEYAQVIVIGIGYFKDTILCLQHFSGPNEKELLTSFVDFVNKKFNRANHLLCAHNGKEFDYPFLCRRLIINQIKIPSILQIAGKKPWEVAHLDTMELWKFGDYKSYTSLNLLANIFHLPTPKDEMDGSEVATVYYKENNLEKIITYCLKDVKTLVNVYEYMSFLPLTNESVVIP